MHKIKKGIKKKIKGKKGKDKEDDLFDPEQLAKFKKELEDAAAAAAAEGKTVDETCDAPEEDNREQEGKTHEQDEEWQKFKLLTSGIDSVLKKTSGDLDRIKESSYFQRTKPPQPIIPPHLVASLSSGRPGTSQNFAHHQQQQQHHPQPAASGAAQKKGPRWFDVETGQAPSESEDEDDLAHKQEGTVDGSEHPAESEQIGDEEEDQEPKTPEVEAIAVDDDLFDTSFVDAVAAGDIKLSYIPDSPDKEEDGDDPFDTSAVAHVVKKIEEEEKKKKRQVNLGLAVNVLTGVRGEEDNNNLQKATTKKAVPDVTKGTRRPRPRNINLLGDDETPADAVVSPSEKSADVPSPEKPDLFDTLLVSSPLDGEVGVVPVPLRSVSPTAAAAAPASNKDSESGVNLKDLLSEFDVVISKDTNSGPSRGALALLTGEEDDLEDEFAALAAESLHKEPAARSVTSSPAPNRPPPPTKPPPPAAKTPVVEAAVTPQEPEEEDPFDTTFVEKLPLGTVEGENKKGEEDDDDFDFDPRAGEEPSQNLAVAQKDLLGGSTTDLSSLDHSVDPIIPESNALIETEIHDPFDTSVVENLLPGKAELKLLEAELLTSGGAPQEFGDDFDDFDPRKDEVVIKLSVNPTVPSGASGPPHRPPPPKVPEIHPLDLVEESHSHFKALTPQTDVAAFEDQSDPFDTSSVSGSIVPGKLELHLLESELVPQDRSVSVNNSVNYPGNFVSAPPQPPTVELESPDFNPREGQEIPTGSLVETVQEHIFDSSTILAEKPLTPTVQPSSSDLPQEEFEDPFDTSTLLSDNLPGKAELKYLEKEFLETNEDFRPPSLPQIPVLPPKPEPARPPSPPPPVPVVPKEPHPLEIDDEHHQFEPLRPLTTSQLQDSALNFEDPFDTTIANTVAPGKAELRILEAELANDLSDATFNPRGLHSIPAAPLVPQTVNQVSSSQNQSVGEDVDPFDTSAAESILPEKDKMATKGFNPFLSESDYAAPAASAEPPSNPFLQDFGGPPPAEKPAAFTSGGGNDNPFFNPFGAPPAAPPPQQPPPPQPAQGVNAFMFSEPPPSSSSSAGGGGNPFASFVDPAPPPANGPFSSVGDGGLTDTSSMWGNPPPPPAPGPPVTEPIFMMDTRPDEQISLFDSGPSGDEMSSPARGPPPTVPQTTQELLDSVTGALEANTESLMDRLRLNQPSPTNLAPSPSPSPRSPSPDLLLGDEPPPPPPSSANPMAPSPHHVDDIMDLFDSPQPKGPKTTMDILGLYNTGSSSSSSSAPVAAPPAPSLVSIHTEPPPPAASEDLVNMVDMVDIGGPAPPTTLPAVEEALAEPMLPQKVASPVSPAVETIPTILSPQQQAPPPPPAAVPPPAMSPVAITPTPIPETVVSSAPPVRAPPPERPKPPPQPPTRSPIHEAKPFPSRPPPPVPPAPRVSPQPPAHGPPPAIPPQPAYHPKPDLPPVPAHPHPPPHPPPPAVPHQPHHAPHPPPVVPPQPAFVPSPEPVAAAPPPVVSPPEPVVVESAYSQHKPAAAAAPAFDFGQRGADVAFGSTPFGSTTTAAAAATTDIVVNPPAAAFELSPASNEFKAPSAFDDFDAKFNSISDVAEGTSSTTASAFGDPFGGSSGSTATSSVAPTGDSAWGSSSGGGGGGGFDDGGSAGFGANAGFGGDSGFDSFLHMTEPPPVPQSTPAKTKREDGEDDDKEDQDLSIFIRPKGDNELNFGLAPQLAPPPKSPAISTNSAYSEDSSSNFVPFLSSARDTTYDQAKDQTQLNRTDSQETPQTPLFEEDTSQPLEDFPRTKFEGDGWDMHMRHPNKKKITGNRFWKKVYVRIVVQNDVPIVHIFTNKGDKDPLQEIPLQPCYSVSDIGAQQFDQYGKIFTLKIQYVFYKERPGVRPGQISKAGRISDKLSQFAAYAIQGDYQGVKEFGSDLKKLGLPLEHAPQISQLVKLGTQTYDEAKQFSACVEEALFRLNVHRDRAITYKTEEVQVTLVDEVFAEQDVYGVVTKQIARVRLFFLSFLSGIAEIEMGMNDLRRQGKEVVGRHDIIPIATEEWIRTEAIEFSNCVQLEEYERTQTIKFKPPDASYIELLRFRVRPPRHRELPLQVKTVFTTTGQRIEIRSDILVPGFTSRKLGQIPCEDVMVRFPIPECWIYMFRVEKHFRYGSVKSAHRRSGKVKGIERFLGAVEAVESSLMEVTSGQAKYEHQHRSIVWRIPRLPKEGQGAYTTHSFFCHITLQAHEQVPDNLSKVCYVEFTMPHTTVSHTVCRSIAVPSCDEPPEKCVRYLSRHEYVVEIEHAQGFSPATYNLAAAVKKEEPAPAAPAVDPTDSWFPTEKPKADDDSDFSDD